MFTFTDTVVSAERKLVDRIERQVPFAASQAINDTLNDVNALVRRQMDIVFDRPTPHTKSAFVVRRASKQTLSGTVEERIDSPRKYLRVQEFGGARPASRVERRLTYGLAYSGLIAAAVPATGAKRDRYGNWSSAERQKVLSALGLQADRAQNSTAKSRKRSKTPDTYFVPRNGGLKPGVWRRDGRNDLKLDMVLAFTDKVPTYKPRLGFLDAATAEAQRVLPGHFARRLEAAFASAR